MTNKYLSRFFDRMKPRMHILKISIFSLNHVIVRPTKIMNNLLKDCKIRTFKVTFWHQKGIFLNQLLNINFFERFNQVLTHGFGKSVNDMV